MATFSESSIQQGTYEIRKWTVDFTNDLPSSVTVTSGTAYHTPPSGSAGSVAVTASSPYVYAQIGTLTVTGVHYLDIVATLSNAETSQVRIAFTVNYPSTTARAGMLDLIQTLRLYGDAGIDDFSVAGVPYWSDAQLQSILDRHRTEMKFSLMNSVETVSGSGTDEYYDYYAPRGWLESGSLLYIQESSGATIGTAAYTMDHENGHATFGTSTGGSAFYITGRSYDMNAAAADLWNRKAGMSAMMYDIKTDNHDLKRSQYMVHCRQMASYYSGQCGISSGDLIRSDSHG